MARKDDLDLLHKVDLHLGRAYGRDPTAPAITTPSVPTDSPHRGAIDLDQFRPTAEALGPPALDEGQYGEFAAPPFPRPLTYEQMIGQTRMRDPEKLKYVPQEPERTPEQQREADILEAKVLLKRAEQVDSLAAYVADAPTKRQRLLRALKIAPATAPHEREAVLNRAMEFAATKGSFKDKQYWTERLPEAFLSGRESTAQNFSQSVMELLGAGTLTNEEADYARKLAGAIDAADPLIVGNWWQKAPLQAAEMGSYMLAAMGSYALTGPAGGVTTTAMIMYPDYAAEFSEELPEDVARPLAAVASILAGGIEMVEPVPGGTAVRSATKQGVMGFMRRFIPSFLKEVGEEGAQRATANLVKLGAKFVDDRVEDPDAREVIKGLIQEPLEEAAEAAAPLLLVGGGMAAASTAKTELQASQYRQFLEGAEGAQKMVADQPDLARQIAEFEEIPSRKQLASLGITEWLSKRQRAALQQNVRKELEKDALQREETQAEAKEMMSLAPEAERIEREQRTAILQPESLQARREDVSQTETEEAQAGEEVSEPEPMATADSLPEALAQTPASVIAPEETAYTKEFWEVTWKETKDAQKDSRAFSNRADAVNFLSSIRPHVARAGMWHNVPSGERKSGVDLSVVTRGADAGRYISGMYSEPPALEGERALIREPKTRRDVGVQEIIRTMEREFDVPMFIGRLGKKDAAGIHKTSQYVIRYAEMFSGNLGVSMHEVAHNIDARIGIVPRGVTGAKGIVPEDVNEELTTLDYDVDKGRNYEGWAEFTRLELVEDMGHRAAPKTHKWFHEEFSKSHPEMYGKLMRTKELMDQRRTMTDQARVKKTMHDVGETPEALVTQAESFKDWLVRGADSFYRAWVDRYKPAQDFDKWLRKKGFDLEKGRQLYDLTMAFSNRGLAHAQRALKYGVHQVREWDYGRSEGKKGLYEILGPVRDDIEEWESWLYARHALEVWGKGMNPGIAKDVAERIYEANKDNGAWKKAANEFTQFNNDLISLLASSGVITNQEAHRMITAWKTYIPLHRAIKGTKGFGSNSAKINSQGATVYRRRGSGQDIVSPIQATVERTMRFYQRAMNQQIMSHLVGMVYATKDTGRWIEILPPRKTRTGLTFEELLKQLEDEGVLEASHPYIVTRKTTRMVKILEEQQPGDPKYDRIIYAAQYFGVDPEEFDFDTEKGRKKFARALRAAAKELAETQLAIYRPNYSPEPRKLISRVIINGKPVNVRFEERLYRMIEGLYDPQVQGIAGIVVSAIRPFQRAIKVGATQYNPEFWARNILRDYQTYLLQREWKGLGSEAKTVFAPIDMMVRAGLQTFLGKESQWIEMYRGEGGEFSHLVGPGRTGIIKLAKRAIAGKDPNIMRTPLDFPRAAANLTEMAPRLAAFRTSLVNDGWTMERIREEAYPPRAAIVRAIRAANDVTIDFGRAGFYGRVFNDVIPFLNAGIQGVDKTIRTFKEQPVVATVRGAELMALTIWWWMRHHEDDWYKEQEPWLRYGFWTIPDANGKPWLRIPRPFEWGWIWTALPQAALDQGLKDHPDAMWDWLKNFVQALPPATEVAGATTLAEYALMFDFYRWQPTVPEYKQEGREPRHWYSNRTQRLWKYIGEQFNHPAFAPQRLQSLADGLTGGLVSRVGKIGGAIEQGDVGRAAKQASGLSGVELRREYTKAVDDFYAKATELQQRVGSSKIDEKFDYDAWGEKLMFDRAADLMREMRELMPEGRDDPKRIDYERRITGLARWALGREPLESYQNPLQFRQQAPDELKPLIKKTYDSYRRASKKSYPKVGTRDYNDKLKRAKALRKSANNWLSRLSSN